MNYKKDLVPGIILAALSSIYYALTFQIAVFKGTGSTPLDSRFMPRFWAVVLFLLAVGLILRGLKVKKSQTGVVQGSLTERAMAYMAADREILVTFLCLAIYIAGLKTIGFIIMTSLYLIFQIAVLTPKGKLNYRMVILVSILVAVIIAYVFVVWLNVLLPQGILGF